MFSQDNNGLAIVLPAIGATGQATVSGSMIFGIGTQSNNGLGAAKAQAVNEETGNFTVTYNGSAYTNSFVDSGSNAIFFLNAAGAGVPDCSSASDAEGFYCPSSTTNFSVITSGPNPNGSAVAVSQSVAFSLANALTLFSSPNTAFNNLGGANPGTFDFGLPFFFGRVVFIGIESQVSAAGVGPYWAF
jgi:hypothetical protein